MSSKTSRKKKVTIKDIDKKWLLLPLILAIGLVPCIVHMYEYNSYVYEYTNGWYGQEASANAVDVFAFWKYILIVILAICMLCILAYRKKNDLVEFSFNTKFYFLFGYLGLSFLSALFSKYKLYAWGISSDEIFENIWVVLAYALFLGYAMLTIKDDNDYRRLMLWASIGLAFVMFIAFFEYIYNEPYQWKWMQKLILRPRYWNNPNTTITMTGQNASTLFNVNNMSYFTVTLIPVYCGLAFADTNIGRKVLWSVLNAFTIVSLIAAKTSTGILAITGVVAAAFVLLLCRKKWGIVVVILGVVAGIAGAVYVLNKTSVGESLQSDFGFNADMSYDLPLEYIETLNDEVVFHYPDNNELHVTQNPNTYQLVVTDGEGKLVRTENISEDETLNRQVADDRFPNTTLSAILIDEANMIVGFGANIAGIDWYFSDYAGYYQNYNYYGNWVTLGYVPPIKELFPNAILTHRGAIWNRLFMKLNKFILIGSGPGTVMYDFPYDNYINKAYAMGWGNSDVRAHQFFLQQWAENGLLATICLIIFYGWYFIDCIRIYHKADFSNPETIIGFSVFLGVFGYMICNLAQDSQVHTASLMWIFTGIGLGFNKKVVDTTNEINKEV